MNKILKIILWFVLVFGILEISIGFLTGLYGRPYVIWGLLLFLFNLLLLFSSFIILLVMWKKWHWKGIIPLGLLIIFILGEFILVALGRSITTQPQNPQNFFTEKTKNELTLTAEKLLESKNQYIIKLFPYEPIEKLDINGNRISDVPNDIVLISKKYRLQRVEVNPNSGMVKFGYYYVKNWHEYIYYKDIKKIPPSFDKKLADHWYYYSW